jgi:tetratricopeptide (TPR) repeat protein
MRDKALLEERMQKLIEMTAGFCDSYLDEDYKQLCERLIRKMARKRNVPFLSGRIEIWAAAIVYALAQNNFLFDHSFEPYASAEDICNYFGTSKSTTSQKAKVVRDMFKMSYFDEEFSTTYMMENNPFSDLVMEDGLIVDIRSQPSEPQKVQREEEHTTAKRKREYVDKDHAVTLAYYNLCDDVYDGRNAKTIKRQVKRLIEKDPDFLDSYLLLYELLKNEGKLQEAEKVLNDAYERAITLITDKKGNWPDVLEWGWLENRHIIRTILNKAISLWNSGDVDNALELFRKLLQTNPNDNVGARDFILAIRMNMSFEEFERQFNKGGYYDTDLVEWFERNYKKFPDEFGWWEKAVEECE